ncbi:MAG: DUF6391 domain-containing protein [Candidatus Promineifilaceae bacterium]|nr:DUF6391 domain-containing protein [Candidatus Promineifilaceae bacterium]
MLDQIRTLVSRTRRNHGLEHATIHVLSENHKKFSAQGHSDFRGFHLNIYGDINEDDVRAAVEEAHRRMKEGEHQLAVHPNCGTVLLTTATLGALASQSAFGLEQRRQRRPNMDVSVFFNGLPSAILAGVLSLIISKPVGMAIQEKFTTEGDLGDMTVTRVRKINASIVTRFFQLLLAPGKDLKVNSYKIETSG